MEKYITKEFISAVQEGLRTTAIAVIGILLVQVQSGNIDFRALIVAVIIGMLRGLEKYLHKIGKETGLEFRILE